MKHTPVNETDLLLNEIDVICSELSEAEEVALGEIFAFISGKWALQVLYYLVKAGQPLRFSEVQRLVEGINQKALTQTLRQLERYGLIGRKVYPEVPPRVEYWLLPQGDELLAQVMPTYKWVAQRLERFGLKD